MHRVTIYSSLRSRSGFAPAMPGRARRRAPCGPSPKSRSWPSKAMSSPWRATVEAGNATGSFRVVTIEDETGRRGHRAGASRRGIERDGASIIGLRFRITGQWDHAYLDQDCWGIRATSVERLPADSAPCSGLKTRCVACRRTGMAPSDPRLAAGAKPSGGRRDCVSGLRGVAREVGGDEERLGASNLGPPGRHASRASPKNVLPSSSNGFCRPGAQSPGCARARPSGCVSGRVGLGIDLYRLSAGRLEPGGNRAGTGHPQGASSRRHLAVVTSSCGNAGASGEPSCRSRSLVGCAPFGGGGT
jgi:hypothetical protein